MKKLYAILFLMYLHLFTHAQTTLYNNNFSGGSAGFLLGQGNNFDTWIVNNIYSCSVTTPNAGGGNYLHIYDDLFSDMCAIANYLGAGSAAFEYATMTSGISTIGNVSDTIQFDWLCAGQTGTLLPSYGSVEYSIDGGISWTQIISPRAKYDGQATWYHAVITSSDLPAMINQSDFRLRFKFTNSGYGLNPPFAIDNLVITGSGSSVGIAGDLENKSQIQIFPNPAKEELKISNPNSKITTIEFNNLLGEKIKVKNIIILGNDATIDLSGVLNGIYFIQVTDDKNSIQNKKIVIQ